MSTSDVPQHLPRGKACVPCRKRKMKCDGNQPTCNQCIRFNRPAECEFSEGAAPSTTRVLEQHIARLQSRITELEQDDPTLVRLHDPYSTSRSNVSTAQQGSQANWWEMPEPPGRVAQTLVQAFTRHAVKLGFFFDVTRFVNSLTNPSAARPAPPSVLRNTVYLWGICLSRNAQFTAHETIFLGRALRSVHLSLSSMEPQQQNVLYVLQAEILLAYYFFHNNRLLEAKFHASAAVSLAHMCNLHKVLSTRTTGSAGPAGFMTMGQGYYLPPPVDYVEEGERVHAWWATFILDKCSAVALSSLSMINENQDPGAVIDTPWPLAMEMYRHQPASLRPNAGSTTARFFADVLTDNEPSHFAMHSKAAALYDRANYLAAYGDKNAAEYQASLSSLDGSLERFKQALPAIERSNPPSADIAHILLLTHSLTHCATITLHRPFVPRSSTSMTRCLTAANTIIRVVQGLGVQRLEFVNPILGALITTASDVLILGLRSLRSSRTAWASSAALPGEEQFIVALNQLSAAMAGLTSAPFIEYQLNKMREAIVAV